MPKKYLVDAFESQKHHLYDIVVGDRRAEAAATIYSEEELDGLIQIEFSVMDAWFEEDEQIYVHPKDPYKVCQPKPKPGGGGAYSRNACADLCLL